MNDVTATSSSGASTVGMLIPVRVFLVIGLGLYLFFCYCCKRVCEKAGHNPGVLIWIPIVQLIPLLRVAGMAE
jgi:hypothetical protein